MASSIPTQTRAIDPFASYNSDTVNELTTMISRGSDGLTDYHALQVTSDSTAPYTQCVVSTGTIFKDNVLITLTQSHVVNFADSDHYVSFGAGFNEAGTYYIVLDYTYAKSRPAPQARIKILKPSQIPHPSLGTSLFFLKAVSVIFTGSTFIINGLYDYDPATPTVEREYTSLYFGVETNLPTHITRRDQGRVVYESETDTFWFGLENRWVELGGGGAGVLVTDVDTTGSLWAGAIAYVDNNKRAQPAIATSARTRADIAVLELGTAALGTSSATMVGTIENVRVETGVTIGVGDIVYLSSIEAGKVSSKKPDNGYVQDLGRALTAGNDSTPITMLFFPRCMLTTSIRGTILTTDWISDSGLYRYDIDITSLDSTGYAIVTSFFADNSGTMELLQPSKVQLLDNYGTGLYDELRVWMPSNTLDVLYNLSSGIGFPGSNGTPPAYVDHSLLLNLDYASSGHTEFAANALGGGHYEADHNFAPYIPSGEIILFEKDTAVTGYTLLTSLDDDLVYITKGSAAGGETGGSAKSGGTWTQPVHAHIITPDGSVHTHVIVNDGSHDHMWKQHFGITDERTWDSPGETTITMNSSNPNRVAGGEGIIISASTGTPYTIAEDFYTNVEGLHDHGGVTLPGDDEHDHGGITGNSATVNTWRPKGINYTRQQRN